MSNVSPLALVSPADLTDFTDLAGLTRLVGPSGPRLRAVPEEQVPAGVYRLPDSLPNPGLVGYLVLVPVGTELDVTAVPAREVPPTVAPEPAAAGPAPVGIVLDRELRSARVDGELLELTYLEFELLAHLTAYPHRVHTRDHLVSAVWGYGHVGDGRTVDVHVARLRRKLGAPYRDSVVTVRRVGYKYVPVSTN